jgi:SAM-dependent methyltransferase
MATDIGQILKNLCDFYDFSGKNVVAVGAGGGQLAEYGRFARKVVAVDRDAAAMDQLRAAAARHGLQDRFEYWTGDFAECTCSGDVVFFEFCLHEIEDPLQALKKAQTMAPDVLVIDHAPGSRWIHYGAEDEKVARSWQALDRLAPTRRIACAAQQRFDRYDELLAKMKLQGQESLRRIEEFRNRTNIVIPMAYEIALLPACTPRWYCA